MLENLLQLFASIIGFIAVFLILFRYKTNRITNIYLVLLILLMSVRYLINGIKLIDNCSFIINLFEDYQNLKMLIYPFTYLYFKHLIYDVKRIKLYDLKHFIILIIIFLIDRRISGLSIYLSKTIYYLYLTFYLCYTISYLILIYRLLINKVWKKKDLIIVSSNQNKLLKKWCLYLTSVILLISIRNTILIVLSFFSFKPNDDYIWISVLATIFVFLKILISPEILYGYDFLINKIENDKKSVILIKSFWSLEPLHEVVNIQDLVLKPKVDIKLLNYINLIDNLSCEESVFRNPDFSMGDLAKHINISKSHLTYLFKYHSTISFPDFKKMLRIQDSVKLIEAGFLKKNTLLTLSKTVGFFTYNPFYLSFKEITGVKPLEYYKNYEKLNL